MVDFIDQKIEVGAHICFIRNERGKPTFIKYGTVKKISEKSLDVEVEDGSIHKVMFSTSRYLDNTKQLKVVVIKDRPNREGNEKDISGYPIKVGDAVAFPEGVSNGSSRRFIKGTVSGLTQKNVNIVSDETSYENARRTFDRVVVIESI